MGKAAEAAANKAAEEAAAKKAAEEVAAKKAAEEAAVKKAVEETEAKKTDDEDVDTVKTSHLDLSDESSDEDIDEILNNDAHDTSFESVGEEHGELLKKQLDLSDESSDDDTEVEAPMEPAEKIHVNDMPKNALNNVTNVGE